MRRLSRDWRRGRLTAGANASSMLIPRLAWGVEEGCEYVAFMVDDRSSDPLLFLEVNLAGTAAGRAVGCWYWNVWRRICRLWGRP